MKSFPIVFGELSKKLSLPFIFALVQIIFDIFEKYYPEYCEKGSKCEKQTNTILNTYALGLGQSLVIILPHIKRFSSKNENHEIKSNYSKSKIFCDFFILLLIDGMIFGVLIWASFLKDGSDLISPHEYGVCSKEIFEIIFLTIISFFLLKYKYYIHNFIGLLLFCITCVVIDLILGSLQDELKTNSTKFILTNIVAVIFEALFLMYQKYMIEKLYYSHWNICFVIGVFVCVNNSFTLSFILMKGKKNSENGISLVKEFYDYFDNVKIIIIISNFILYTLLQFLIYVFKYLTIYNFTPSHLLICYELSKMVKIFIEEKKNNKYKCIFLSILQFFF